MNSGSCSHMTPSCKRPIEKLVTFNMSCPEIEYKFTVVIVNVNCMGLYHAAAMLIPRRIKCFVFPCLTSFSTFSLRGLGGKSFVFIQNGGA